MKIALVHELLTMRGGAERVFKILTEMFPEAPIYTLLYDKKKLGDWFPKERIRTPNFPFPYSMIPSTNHHLFLRAFPKAVESWDFSEFDVVLSTSSAFIHGIITNSAPKHLCYVNSPARYLWDRTHDILDRAGKGPIGFLKRRYLSRTFHKLRVWDAEAAARPDKLLAASREVQRRIELYWRRESDVLYPPINDFWFEGDEGSGDFFLIVSTLVPYKKIEIAIEACNVLKLPLRIAGTGPDLKRLKKLAGPNIQFLGFQSEESLRKLYTRAEATLFVGEEDFGLVPLESMACGTPVIALRKGGALETVTSDTGIFFDQQTSESLKSVLATFNKGRFTKEKLRAHAQKFSREKFEAGIRKALAEL